jgi:hypothetical protein
VSRRGLGCVALVVLGACFEPYVMKENVTGPLGEPAIALYCPNRDQCTLLARQLCRGNFDYVDPTLPKTLIQCRLPPPGAVHVAPDAGP